MANPFRPLDQETIAELWGGPLPALEQVYIDLSAEFSAGRPDVAPYLMKKIFSLEEAALAAALPGTPEEVAVKQGISVEEAADKLYQMVIRGKILAIGDGKYARFTNLGEFKDWVYAQEKYDSEYDQATARLMKAWDWIGDFFSDLTPGAAPVFRIVPKWESIRNVPGVMPCENIPQMMREHVEEISFNRCPCRAVSYIARFGSQQTDQCRTGLREGHEPRDGVCIASGRRSEYFVRYLGGYQPTPEEVEDKIAKIEQAGSYYGVANIRNFVNVCNCCDDCDCGVRKRYDLGDEEAFSKSRFVAYLEDANACIGCGACEDICPFRKSVTVTDGIASVDETRCHGCGNCVVHCPTGALKMKIVRPASHIPRIEDMFNNKL